MQNTFKRDRKLYTTDMKRLVADRLADRYTGPRDAGFTYRIGPSGTVERVQA